jgi:ketosteroid isomerase-like protein
MVTSQVSDGKTIVQTFYEDCARHDMDKAFGAMHPEFEIQIPGNLPWGGVHHGAEGFKTHVMPKLALALDPHSVKVQSIYGEGDKVFATVTARSASGEDLIIGEDWTVKDGRLYRARVYYFDSTPVTRRPPQV